MFRDKATGVTKGERRYGKILGMNVQIPENKTWRVPLHKLLSLHEKIISQNPEVTRVLYSVRELSKKKPYVIAMRSVQTENFLTAEVSEIPWSTLAKAAEEIINECPKVSTVFYDVTPKPPATIEME
jgi:GMP synthase (glutamine-hydrolysing)